MTKTKTKDLGTPDYAKAAELIKEATKKKYGVLLVVDKGKDSTFLATHFKTTTLASVVDSILKDHPEVGFLLAMKRIGKKAG